MIQPEDLKIRKLDFQGVKTLLEWATAEGWNPGPHDAEVYWVTDPDGFYGYYQNEYLVAGGAIISYGSEFGFMGLFIVRPEFRSHGIGRKLWYQRRDLLKERLKQTAPIGMDGVVDMQSFYRKGGFEIAFKDERYEKTGREFLVDPNVIPIKKKDLPDILKYDQECFGFSRPQFLTPWFNLPENKSFEYFETGQVKGYCILRKVHHGYKIGPLFADDRHIADELYKACLNSVIGEPVYIDIPMINEDAVQLIKDHRARYIFECARMYHGQPPNMAMNKVYGITTFELG